MSYFLILHTSRYQELVEFHAQFGKTRVPENYEAAPKLHTFVSGNRCVSIHCVSYFIVHVFRSQLSYAEEIFLCGLISSQFSFSVAFYCFVKAATEALQGGKEVKIDRRKSEVTRRVRARMEYQKFTFLGQAFCTL